MTDIEEARNVKSECPSYGKGWDGSTRNCQYCKHDYESEYYNCKALTTQKDSLVPPPEPEKNLEYKQESLDMRREGIKILPKGIYPPGGGKKPRRNSRAAFVSLKILEGSHTLQSIGWALATEKEMDDNITIAAVRTIISDFKNPKYGPGWLIVKDRDSHLRFAVKEEAQ